ncbi:MAG: hypothetical protein WDZ35_06885 [Crocinitomicaceae bacterium]
MKKMTFTLFTCLTILTASGQLQTIDIAELTIKIGSMGSEELFYGFAEGDQIVFSFEELKGKELKEVEIIELPSSSKFMDYKTTKIENKKILVNQKGVYLFKFNNSALAGRICKVKIQRIPKSEEFISFNTNWEWKTLYDTTYVPYTQDSLVGYDTTYVNKTKKELVKIDTLITELFNKTERVHSETAIDKTQYAYLNVNLPTNTYSPNKFNPYQSTEVISWSYWLGVGQKAVEEYEKANSNLSSGISAIGALTGYGALASLAVTGVSMFATPSVGDNVEYKFITAQNGVNKTFDFGNGTSASGRNTNLLQGGFTIQLFNDNFRDGIDVTVKLACVQIRKTWKDKQYKEQVVKPRHVTLNKKKMVIDTNKIRVNAN